VNLIIVRLSGAQDARDLEAKWVGGKKNDLVLCYWKGWSYVFGWTEATRVKRELETLLLKPVDDTLIPSIDKIVREHYTIVPWEKFDYLSLQPTMKQFVVFVVITLLIEAGAMAYALLNCVDKCRKEREFFAR
jgi:hypothetical protein